MTAYARHEGSVSCVCKPGPVMRPAAAGLVVGSRLVHPHTC